MLRGLSIPRPSRPATNAKKLTFNANLEGHKIQVSQINSSTSKTSFHVKTGQKAAQVTINSTPQAFRFCVQPTKATNLKNETPVVFFVNRRHNSNTQETKETKEEATQDKQKTQDKENPLSTNYHTSLPADKQSLQHVFEPIPKAAKMPSLWLFLIAIILIKEMLSRQSEGIADDLIFMFRRYEDAKEAQDEEQLRSIEASLIQAMNFSSLLFLMGNPKIKSPALLQEVCNFLLSEHPANTSDLALQLLNAAVHCSKHILGQVELPLGDIAAKFLSKDMLKDTTIVNSLSQVLDTLIIDGYDVTKIASAPGIVPLVDLMAHHPDATIATRASHIFRSIAQNPSSAPTIKDNVATLIHVIKRQDNNESVVYAKEAVQGLIAAGNANPEIKADVEKQLYNGTVSQELVNEITRFERPVSFSKLPKIGTELGLAVVVAVVWGYLRWSRALKKKGVSGEDLQKIVRYRTALTAGVTSVAVGTSILEDNVLAHQSELAADVVAFIGWPLFLAVTPFIIIPSFLSAIVSSHAFDKICDEHRRHFNPTRKPFIHNGRTIYEWDQTLDEVNIYIQLPEGVKAKQLDCKITTSDLSVGIKGNPPYIKESFFFPVKNKDSFWTVEDGELHITLSKLSKGETWLGALKGHQQLNPVEEESAKKQLMLERFQEENPGFDFSGAEFSGQAPDPKTFMDGIA